MKCKPCPPGYFSNQEGASQCTACSYFQFQAKEGWCIIYHIIDLCHNDVQRCCQGSGGGGGSHVTRLNFEMSHVSVNACRLLSALPSLLQFGQGRWSFVEISFYALSLLFGACRLSEFTLAGPHVQKSPLSAILSIHNHHER